MHKNTRNCLNLADDTMPTKPIPSVENTALLTCFPSLCLQTPPWSLASPPLSTTAKKGSNYFPTLFAMSYFTILAQQNRRTTPCQNPLRYSIFVCEKQKRTNDLPHFLRTPTSPYLHSKADAQLRAEILCDTAFSHVKNKKGSNYVPTLFAKSYFTKLAQQNRRTTPCRRPLRHCIFACGKQKRIKLFSYTFCEILLHQTSTAKPTHNSVPKSSAIPHFPM